MWNQQSDTAAAAASCCNKKKKEMQECKCASNDALNSNSKFAKRDTDSKMSNAAAAQEEAIDSGFLSGLNTCSSLAADELTDDSEFVKNNLTVPNTKQTTSEKQQQQQQQTFNNNSSNNKKVQESKTFLDSGCIEAEEIFEDDDIEIDDTAVVAAAAAKSADVGVTIAKRQSEALVQNELRSVKSATAKISKATTTITGDNNQLDTAAAMRFKNNVDSGIAEHFCSLSLQSGDAGINNLNATPRQRSNTVPLLFDESSAANEDVAQQQNSRKQSLPSNQQQQQQQQQRNATNKTRVNDWEQFYQQNSDGDTPLHLACFAGAEDVVVALMRIAIHPCLYNIQNDDAQTPLHMAALSAHPKILRLLLIFGALPTVRDRNGNTALHLAVNSGEEQCVRALLTPISAAEIQEGIRVCAQRYTDKKLVYNTNTLLLPMDLEIRNYNGERCVHLAAQAGHINILRMLVSCGADINAREGKSGRTPLHIAIESCNEALVNFLLEECQTKLNLETATYAGLTAYQIACLLDREQLQCKLEKRGAEPLTPPDSDYTDSDGEDIEESKIFGDPNYFISYGGQNAMRVA